MKKLLVFFALGIIFVLSNNVYAEKSYVINIPTGAASPKAPYFWQSEKDGNTQGLIDVAVNDTINWMNADTVQHTVVSGNPNNGPDGIFDSGLITTGGSFSHIFSREGTYDYFCSVHPWMTGAVTVNLIHQKLSNVGKEVGDGKKVYDIEYLFDRLISVISIDTESKSIMLEIVGRTDVQESNLVLRLPIGLIDGPFVVWIDGDKVDFKHSEENNQNILKIPVSSSSKILTVSGAHIVPEFGASVTILLAISIITVLCFSNVIFSDRLRM